jgi:hypothetical protein
MQRNIQFSSPTANQQMAVGFLLCKNFGDMAETALVIRESLNEEDRENLPSSAVINLIINAMSGSYPDELFTDEGFVYDSAIIDQFEDKTGTVSRVYKGAKQQFTKKVCERVKAKDEVYFLDVFDEMVKGMPFSEYIVQFKGYISNDKISQEDRDSIWDFFEAMMDIVENEMKYITECMTE